MLAPLTALRYNAAVQAVAPPDFITANDMLVARRDAHSVELAARKMARDSIADPMTRAIGAELQAGDEHSARTMHLRSLGHLAMAHEPPIPGASDRVNAALARARAQGNYSAIEALERELDRDAEDTDRELLLAVMDS